jgi:hypothetical protein
MPKKIRTLDDNVADLRGLSARTAENASDLPDITAERNTLDKSLEGFDDARKRQQIHEAERQKATQDMRTALGRGKEAARQIRLAVKVGLGARNEKLVLFNVAPLRTNAGRKSAVLQPLDEPGGTTGGTTAAPAPPNPKPTNP